jgi:dynein heavy chain
VKVHVWSRVWSAKDKTYMPFSQLMLQEWKEFLSCPAPEREGQVPYFDNRSPQGFDEFRRLALIRFYRPDRFAAAVRGLLFRRLDPPLRQPSNMNIHDAYLKSDPYTPIVILTCQNLNATRIIKNAAHSKVIQSQSISLGNVTQREVARKMMLTGPGLGMWLILENGHLDSSYLSVIPSTIEHMDFSDEHFRLFILAEATPSFPISLLDISLRQYAEPALGLKAKFTASLSWIEQDTLESVATPDWMMLLYSMSFLNAWMLSRREFGHIGWCLQHEFHRNDLLECFNFMKSIIEINEKARSGHSRGDIPWPTVQNMYRDIVLGSAFEHGNDSAVLDTQLKRYMSSRIFSGDFHFGLDFPGPVGQDIQATIRVLQNREVEESADVFGLNSAVSRASDQATSNDILLSLGTVFSSSTTATLDIHLLGHEQDAVEIAKCILEDLPENLKTQRAPARVSSSPLSQGKQMKRPMYFFAAAEQRHLHYLLDTVRKDLHLLISSLKAGMHITPEQNHFARDLLTGITPKNWADLSFPIELLSQWFEHTKEAHSQVAVLVDPVGLKGSISLGHCFRPSAFLRYHLQHMCQLHSMPLESVQLSVKFGGPAESPSNDKTKEFLLTGLWLQGAGWDARALKLVASPYNAPKLVALPPARLIVEQRPSETAPIPVEGNQVLNFVAPLYASTPANVCKSAGDGLPITHALFLTVSVSIFIAATHVIMIHAPDQGHVK